MTERLVTDEEAEKLQGIVTITDSFPGAKGEAVLSIRTVSRLLATREALIEALELARDEMTRLTPATWPNPTHGLIVARALLARLHGYEGEAPAPETP